MIFALRCAGAVYMIPLTRGRYSKNYTGARLRRFFPSARVLYVLYYACNKVDRARTRLDYF